MGSKNDDQCNETIGITYLRAQRGPIRHCRRCCTAEIHGRACFPSSWEEQGSWSWQGQSPPPHLPRCWPHSCGQSWYCCWSILLLLLSQWRCVRVVSRRTRSNRTTCRHLFGKKSVDPIIGNRSILMHFWIDLIKQCTYQVDFFYFFAFLKSYGTKCVLPLQALTNTPKCRVKHRGVHRSQNLR